MRPSQMKLRRKMLGGLFLFSALGFAKGKPVKPDRTGPSVAFAAPAAGATVNGVVNVSIAASDNVGIARIELRIDAVLVGTAASYAWDTTLRANGTASLTATAYDAAGNAAIASIAVSVLNVQSGPPPIGTLFVSPSGSDANPGTEALPFLTLQKAADVANPGDVVEVLDGVYTSAASRYADRVIQFNRGGTVGNPITFRARNKWSAVIDGQSNATTYGIVFLKPYITVDGFQFRDLSRSALWLYNDAAGTGAHDIGITRNLVHHIGRKIFADCNSGGGGAYSNGYVHHVTWDRNLFHDLGRMPNTACTDNDNYVHDHALYLQGKYHTVTNNVFYNLFSGWGVKVDGFYGALDDPSDASHVINGNTFAYAVDPFINGHVRFFANNPRETDSGNTMNFPVNVIVENNISYHPPAYVLHTLEAPAFVSVDGPVNGVWGHNPYSGAVIRNNLTTAQAVIDINENITLANNQVLTDPLFVDAAGGDFHLAANSPAITAGIAAGLSQDFDGVARPTTPDIGAYEH